MSQTKPETNSKEKALVYIDVNNIFHRFKKLEWIKLRKSLEAIYEIERINAYNSVDHSNQAQNKFNTYLSNNGYRIEDPDCNVMSNVDPMIITHILNDSNVQTHRVVILIACDGGYSYPLNELAKCGYKIHIIGCRNNTSLELLKIADEISYLEDLPGVVIE